MKTIDQVPAIILAAGASSRYGSSKVLLPWGAGTVLQSVIRACALAGISAIYVVLGSQSNLVKHSLEGETVNIVDNPAWADGQASSLKAGLAAIAPESKGVLFVLADQPQISPLLIRTIALKGLQTGKSVLPVVNGRRAHPVYFPKTAFEDLMSIEGDQGGRAIMGKHPTQLVDWLDEDMALDIDTPRDYESLCSSHGNDSSYLLML